MAKNGGAPSMVAHAYNLSTHEAGQELSQIQDQALKA